MKRVAGTTLFPQQLGLWVGWVFYRCNMNNITLVTRCSSLFLDAPLKQTPSFCNKIFRVWTGLMNSKFPRLNTESTNIYLKCSLVVKVEWVKKTNKAGMCFKQCCRALAGPIKTERFFSTSAKTKFWKVLPNIVFCVK